MPIRFTAAEKVTIHLTETRSPSSEKLRSGEVIVFLVSNVEEGAELLVGREGRPQGLEAGFFVKPTVFINVKN